MKYISSRFANAKQLIESYTYPEPFHLHLKQFYRNNKKFGSRDRREISALCYAYWRLPFTEQTLNQKLFAAISSFDVEESALNQLKEQLSLSDFQPPDTLPTHMVPSSLLEEVFTEDYRSENWEYKPRFWVKEHLGQANGYLDLPGCEKGDMNIEAVFPYQVQDVSSQFMCDNIKIDDGNRVWDCCSGSGGKSLNLLARNKGEFFITDVRDKSIMNAKSRLKTFGYSAKFDVVDVVKATDKLTIDDTSIEHGFFDVIIVDAPCSGSGTWFRNPEHFTQFDLHRLQDYQERQIAIVEKASAFLNPSGVLYYLTCSVFTDENKAVVDSIQQKGSLVVRDQWRFAGMKHGGDSMFMASFKLPEKPRQ